MMRLRVHERNLVVVGIIGRVTETGTDKETGSNATQSGQMLADRSDDLRS
jgi:hypothetical protein